MLMCNTFKIKSGMARSSNYQEIIVLVMIHISIIAIKMYIGKRIVRMFEYLNSCELFWGALNM